MLEEHLVNNDILKIDNLKEEKLTYEVDKSPITIDEILPNTTNNTNPPNNTNDESAEAAEADKKPALSQSQLFYDQYSRKLLYITKDKLDIYNKSLSKLKKSFHINLKTDPRTIITKATLNKELRRIIIQTDNPYGTNKGIELFELETSQKFNKTHKDLSMLLDFFFVSERVFCFIFPNLISLYEVEIKRKAIKTIRKVEYDKKLIQNFKYNSDFQILIILKTDLTFDIYNLSDSKFYEYSPKNLKFSFMHKSNDIIFSSLSTGFFSFSKDKEKKFEEAKKFIYSNFRKPEYHYRKSQFYLESIYLHLYFIYFNLEQGKIFIYKLENINDFINEHSKNQNNMQIINFPRNFGCATLQFVDNLILVHNFNENKIYVYDIDLKKRVATSLLLCICKTSFYDENTIKQDFIVDNLFIKKPNRIFKVRFNADNYYTLFPFKSNKEEALINMLQRKEAQDYILHSLKNRIVEYSLHPRNIMKILEIQEYIVVKINESYKFLERYALIKATFDLIPIKQKLVEIQSYPEVGRKLNKRLITVKQFIDLVFFPLSDLPLEDFRQRDVIMRVLFIFNTFFKKKELVLPKIFLNVIVKILKKIKNLSDMKYIIQNYGNLLISNEISEYFMANEFIKLDDYILNSILQLLERGKYYEKVFAILLNLKGVEYALDYIFPYINSSNIEKIRNILISNKSAISKERKKLISYLGY